METRVIAKVVVVNAQGKILLLRRSESDVRRPLQWDVPGGHTDGYEYANEAAARETLEEAGITVNPRELQLAYTDQQMAERTLNVIWLFYIAQTNATLVTTSHEHDESRWVSLDEAIELIEYDRQKHMLEYLRDNNLIG